MYNTMKGMPQVGRMVTMHMYTTQLLKTMCISLT